MGSAACRTRLMAAQRACPVRCVRCRHERITGCAAARAVGTGAAIGNYDPIRAGGADRRCPERGIRADALDSYVFDRIRGPYWTRTLCWPVNRPWSPAHPHPMTNSSPRNWHASTARSPQPTTSADASRTSVPSRAARTPRGAAPRRRSRTPPHRAHRPPRRPHRPTTRTWPRQQDPLPRPRIRRTNHRRDRPPRPRTEIETPPPLIHATGGVSASSPGIRAALGIFDERHQCSAGCHQRRADHDGATAPALTG